MSSTPQSAEVTRAFLEAHDLAAQANQTLSSIHLLLALFTFPNAARVLMRERGLTEKKLLKAFEELEEEPAETVGLIQDRARDVAHGAGARRVESLHLLVALIRGRDVFAATVLGRTDVSVSALRNTAVGYLTGHLPRKLRDLKPDSDGSDDGPIVPGVSSMFRRLRHGNGATQNNGQLHSRRLRSTALPSEPLQTSNPDHGNDGTFGPEGTPGRENTFAHASDAPNQTARTAPTTSATSATNTIDDDPLAAIAPTLAECGINLTAQASRGELDEAIERDEEIHTLLDILGKRRANNPVLVGPPGVGKTAIVEGLAQRLWQQQPERTIVALDTGALLAGTSLRGAFSERLGAIKTEVSNAAGQIVVFIDELHTIIGAGASGEGAQDAANELKAALARGTFPCIGATTFEEYKRYIEKDPALERRFTMLEIEEPTPRSALRMLEASAQAYTQHHGLPYTPSALAAAVQLAHRYVRDRYLPDKAFAVLDLAGSRARRRGAMQVDRNIIAEVVHELSGVPHERLVEDDGQRSAQLYSFLSSRVFGQDDALANATSALQRGLAGLHGSRPLATLLMHGPDGVGQSALIRAIASFLFGHDDAVLRFDMREHTEPHSISRLLGAQPGYVGYEEGGQLLEALRKNPFQVIHFDHITSAHYDIQAVIAGLLQSGRVTDTRGRTVHCSQTVVVLSTHAPSEGFGVDRTLGFHQEPQQASAALEPVRRQLLDALWSHLDAPLLFEPLNAEALEQIADHLVHTSAQQLYDSRGLQLRWDADVISALVATSGAAQNARGLKQVIMKDVEGIIAQALLAGELAAGDEIILAAPPPRSYEVLNEPDEDVPRTSSSTNSTGLTWQRRSRAA